MGFDTVHRWDDVTDPDGSLRAARRAELSEKPGFRRPEYEAEVESRIREAIYEAVRAEIEAEARRQDAVAAVHLRQAVVDYLDNLHSATWGRMFLITKGHDGESESRSQAIDFICDLVVKVLTQLQANETATS